MTIETLQPDFDGVDLRIGIVQSRFNEPVCLRICAASTAELESLGVTAEDILIVTVPGALEIPLALQKMAESEQFDALIAVGAVIRGETYHFELVSNESASGINRVALDFGIPVVNAVLTTDTDAQAEARAAQKGADAAHAAVEMANLVAQLDGGAEDDDETTDDDRAG